MILCKIVNEITVNCSFTEVKCSHIQKVDLVTLGVNFSNARHQKEKRER